jgi:hypothetical protein
MTRIKTNGINKKMRFIIFFSCLVTLYSCGTIKQDVVRHNYFKGDFFFNDTINVSIDFMANIIQEDLSKIKKSKLEKELRGIKGISADNLFLKCHPESGNSFDMYYFLEKTNNPVDTLTHQSLISNDLKNKIAIYEKRKGTKKVICIVHSFVKDDNDYAQYRALNSIQKVAIDSSVSHQISTLGILKYYAIENKNGNYLQARKKLETAPLKEKKDINLRFEFLRTINSFIDNNTKYDSTMIDYEKSRRQRFNKSIDAILMSDGVKKSDAVFEEISTIAKNNQIIILNEDHNYPKHRLFAMELLDVLKKNGYTYLSLEAFNTDDENHPVPNIKNGFYTRETYFAHFIRKANTMGFSIVGHDSDDDNIDREVGQAKNIMKILDKDPKAKIFIYVGHSHLEKEGRKRWMASYLKEYSKINPITINQVKVIADTKEEIVLIPKKVLEKDTLIKSSADYFVINNLKPNLTKIYKDRTFKDVFINNNEFKKYKKQQLLINVYDWEERNKNKLSIPILSFLERPKGTQITTKLPIGKYYIDVRSDENKSFKFPEIEVK